jgi:putative copper export protein/methionine-rich copper-binding protein CopC
MPLFVWIPDRPAPWRGAGLALALLGMVLLPSAALAHQNLLATSPAAGDTLLAVPGEIRFTFTEPVRLEFTDVVVQGPGGALVVGALRRATDNPRVLVAPVARGWHAGEFTVRWTTVGADGHRTDGTVLFFVREDADGLPASEPEPEPAVDTAHGEGEASPPHHDSRLFPETPTFGPQSLAYVAIRALLFLALVAMLGALALRWVVLPVTAQQRPGEAEALRGAVDRGAARVGLVAAVALLLAALARLWAQSASLFGVAGALDPGRLAQALTLQPWALGWWLQVAAAVVGTAGFLLAARTVRGGWTLAVAAALVAAATPALSGHASAMGPLSWVAVPTDTLHVIAAGGWIGSLLALVVIGIPAALRLDPGRRGAVAAALVQGFSPTALVFTGILVATGVVSAWLHLGQFAALWTSAYGRTLLLKVGIFAGVALVGAYNFLRVRPALGEAKGAARLRRSGTVELLLALAVVIVTAVLVALPPP